MGTLNGALIGLGSNLGDRAVLLDGAIAALAEIRQIEVRAVSSYWETDPVGGPPGQGPFLNASAALRTTLDPLELLGVLQAIEARAGRSRMVRWGERTLDLDLLIFEGEFRWTAELIVPHPRLAVRRFVLDPLVEIAPEVIHPATGLSLAELRTRLDRRPGRIALLGPPGPIKAEVFGRLASSLAGRDWIVSDLDFVARPPGISEGPSTPTFGVVVDPEGSITPGPRQTDFPLLWPESNGPEAILAEALAACSASRESGKRLRDPCRPHQAPL
ncbi:hypothetical protein BH23PLA1_BH23PLA1_33180 [soil metagenome]